MNTYVEPVCPFEWCEVGGVHYHRTDFGVCKCRPGDPGHEASGAFTTRCYAPRPGNAKPETDPRTVPAEPDPRVKAVAQVLAEKAGISLDEAEATLVVQALDRMGDDSVTYPTTTAHYMEDL